MSEKIEEAPDLNSPRFQEMMGLILHRYQTLKERNRELEEGMEELLKDNTKLSRMAGAVVTAMESELQRSRDAAERDLLTGALNRYGMEQWLSKEAAVERRGEKKQRAILELDLDNFKKVNDTYGHPVGDAVLKKLVEILKTRAGEDALIDPVRWGGEEFLVIFNGATAEDIMGKKFKDGAHIRFDLDVASPESEGGVTTLHITMSGGLATIEEGEKLTDAIERADKALYWAKNNGKDRIALAP